MPACPTSSRPAGSGTRLTNTAELDPPLPLSIVGNVVCGRIKASVAENLGVLETLLCRRQLFFEASRKHTPLTSCGPNGTWA